MKRLSAQDDANTATTNANITSGSVTGITDITVADGGTGRSTSTTAYGLLAAGTTATGAHQTLSAGATTDILVGGGASALPVWTAASGSGSPVRATSPSLTTPTIASFTNATHDHTNAAGGGALTWQALPTGSVIQVVITNFSAVGTTTTLIPFDDTIPQNTEGGEFMTRAITPKSTSNTLVIEAIVFLSHSVSASALTVALFQDSTANALAATDSVQQVATGPITIPLAHSMAAGTTSSTTFKIRCGSNLAGTTTFNGQAGGRIFGAITKSWIQVTEIKA